MKKKKILFAAVDIGFRIEHYSKFIQENFDAELEVESFSKYILPANHFQTNYTFSLPFQKNKLLNYGYIFYFFIYSLFKYDIFHFISGETILTRKLRKFELWTYKKLGKKIIMHFVGADIRSVDYLEWKEKNMPTILTDETLVSRLVEPFQEKLIADTRKFADRIIVSTPDLLEIIPEADYLPVFLDFDHLPEIREKAKDVIKILFSPSGIKTKGNRYIYEVLRTVKETFRDQVEIITPGIHNKEHYSYSTSRYNLFNLMNECHLVVDQMLIGWYGLKSVEALAMNCEVFCYIDKKYTSYLFEDCPIMTTNILDFEQDILNFIRTFDFSKEKNIQVNWVKHYHNINTYLQFLKELWLK